jgi:hypothetical protein
MVVGKKRQFGGLDTDFTDGHGFNISKPVRADIFVAGRFPGVVALLQPRANFLYAFSVFKSVPISAIRVKTWRLGG